MVTGSDDGSAKLYDLRKKTSLATFDCMYQVTAVAFSDDALTVYTGGIDNDIKVTTPLHIIFNKNLSLLVSDRCPCGYS